VSASSKKFRGDLTLPYLAGRAITGLGINGGSPRTDCCVVNEPIAVFRKEPHGPRSVSATVSIVRAASAGIDSDASSPLPAMGTTLSVCVSVVPLDGVSVTRTLEFV